MKKLLAIVLSLMLCLSACSFAAAEETDPAKILTQGVWNYAFAVEGMNDFVYYFHFYECVLRGLCAESAELRRHLDGEEGREGVQRL